jgi:antitoxin ParD1/3/4
MRSQSIWAKKVVLASFSLHPKTRSHLSGRKWQILPLYREKINQVTLVKSMNISLPDSMRSYVEEQVATGGYSTVSEYFRELVRSDQKRKANERLETLLLEGLDSGSATPMSDRDWEDVRQAVRERVAKRQGSNQE